MKNDGESLSMFKCREEEEEKKEKPCRGLTLEI